jgi:hypothetical protein
MCKTVPKGGERVKNLRARLMIFSVTLASFTAAAAHLAPILKGRGFQDGHG